MELDNIKLIYGETLEGLYSRIIKIYVNQFEAHYNLIEKEFIGSSAKIIIQAFCDKYYKPLYNELILHAPREITDLCYKLNLGIKDGSYPDDSAIRYFLKLELNNYLDNKKLLTLVQKIDEKFIPNTTDHGELVELVILMGRINGLGNAWLNISKKGDESVDKKKC